MIVYTGPAKRRESAAQEMETAMKAVAMMSMALLALAATAALGRDWDDNFVPRDPAVKQPGHYEWTWDGKDSLGIEAPVNLHYTQAGSPRIVITGPDELLAHVQVGQGRIRTDQDWHYSGREHLQVTVTGVTVHNIALSGSGQASLEKLDLDHLNLAISGSGMLTGDGHVEHANLSLSGSGNADLSHLSASTANIHISGSGKARLTPHDSANVAVSGSGIVWMSARPAHLNQSISGSGGVRIDGN
jgi:hypothetical protein